MNTVYVLPYGLSFPLCSSTYYYFVDDSTYPTQLRVLLPSFAWVGTLPFTSSSTSTCLTAGTWPSSSYVSFATFPIPSSPTLPVPDLASVDPEDPFGHTYELMFKIKGPVVAADLHAIYPHELSMHAPICRQLLRVCGRGKKSVCSVDDYLVFLRRL